MFTYSYIPIVKLPDLNDAMSARFGRIVGPSELFDEYHPGFMHYALNHDKEIGQLRPEVAVVYMLVKTVLVKDFKIYGNDVLFYLD